MKISTGQKEHVITIVQFTQTLKSSFASALEPVFSYLRRRGMFLKGLLLQSNILLIAIFHSADKEYLMIVIQNPSAQ